MGKGVIFDLDGTLINSIEDLGTSMNVALEALGCPERSLAFYKGIIGGGVKDFTCQSLPENDRSNEPLVAECMCMFQEHYQDHWADKSHLYEGIAEMLDYFQAQGVPMNILSNKPDAFVQNIVKHYFQNWSFVCVSGAVENFLPKPDPTLLKRMMQIMNLDAQDMYYIGDTEVDVATARNAGCLAVAVMWGFRHEDRLRAARPDYCLQEPAQLKDLIG